MLLASIRLGFLLATLVASLHVAASPRFWTLTDVRFNQGGTIATGYFSYDDATQTIENWNVRVNDPFAVSFPAFTYVPGNSMAYTFQAPDAVAPTLVFSAAMGVPGPYFGVRQLQIAPPAALDGSNVSVPLNFVSREDFGEGAMGRWITTGSLALTAVPPAVVVVQVDEFYNPVLRHYFITASAAEKQDLDTGVHPGWERTGESFKAYATGSSAGGTINPVCRYYSPPDPEYGGPGSDSHFYSVDAGECLTVFRKYASVTWQFESDNVFQIDLPDKTSGACPAGTISVYRLWNQRVIPMTANDECRDQYADLAVGYLPEGYGADGVVMCALQ